ncbi:DUF6748 domain-containing protein [Hyalangium rubrum]|uniref:DUF6748 domain-containing protein n=1 Tax=Hyalangium rubrum TaxID=3103134 RepID=A0ABU5HAV2_9BACT|nr:DUF6748 domain-containing protein [Hyalangium sp. s54d21]MDY7230214.1 DUF6748 domain-containing protein [Hyalangium sp. s54d21]
MNVRLLSLSVLCLGLVAGCAKQSPTPEAPLPDTAQPAQPANPSGAASTSEAAGQGQPVAYVVRNSGIRCIAPPCATHLAVPVANPSADAIQIHEIDLSALNPSQERQEELMRTADESPDGLKVEAVLDKQLKAGPAGDATVLRVKKVLQ